MTSKYLADTPKHHPEVIQNTTAPPTPYSYTEDGGRNKIDGSLLNTGDFRHSTDTLIHQDGLASPVLGFQRHFPPPRSTRTAPTPLSGEFSTWAKTRRLCTSQWQNNKGPIYVFTAQFFGAFMNLIARLLELGDVDTKLHPMQILFWRMVITSLACSIYIVWQRIPHGVL